MKTVKYVVIWTIILGSIALALNFVWPNSITFLQQKTSTIDTQGIYYTYNFQNYLQNLTYAAEKTSMLSLKMPTREWKTGAWEVISLLDQISNNLQVILDYMILPINIFLWPIRLIAYVTELTMAFIGFNVQNMPTGNPFKWLTDLLNWFITNLQIPYSTEW